MRFVYRRHKLLAASIGAELKLNYSPTSGYEKDTKTTDWQAIQLVHAQLVRSTAHNLALRSAWLLRRGKTARGPRPPTGPLFHAYIVPLLLRAPSRSIRRGSPPSCARKDHRLLRNEGPCQCPYFLVRAGDEESAKFRCCFEPRLDIFNGARFLAWRLKINVRCEKNNRFSGLIFFRV
jgi:hypothetical protein